MNSYEQQEAAMKATEAVLNHAPPVFYDGHRFLLDNGRDYVPMDRQSIKAHLRQAKVGDIEAELCRAQSEYYVKYAGPLAGHDRGLVESNGSLLLATTSPCVIPSRAGPFPVIEQFLQKLLGGGDHGAAQLSAFMGWMHVARMAMLERKRRPGQALVLAGPIASGKTQLIKLLVVPAMGGRQVKPYRYFSGKTAFNEDLASGEVMVIDDEASSTRIELRRALGDAIKTNLFASSVSIHGKGKKAFEFAPLWRLIVAVNDQPESLLVLPPLSRDLSDKLMILKCSKAIEMNDADFEVWTEAIREELPAFLSAVEAHVIEPDQADGRCGIRSFYHPEVIEAISELSPEQQLRSLIDALHSTGGIALPWVGTAADLKALLMSFTASTRGDAERLLGAWPAACGVYLGRLAGSTVEKLPMLDGTQRWRIFQSSGQVETDSGFTP